MISSKWLCSLMVISLFAFNNVMANSEIEQKAKIIKHLAGLVTWSSNVINVCLLGNFADGERVVEKLNGKMIKEKKLQVLKKDTLDGIVQTCNIVYISNSEKHNAKKIIEIFDGKPALLISDIPDFAQNGGSINFMMLNKILAITLNLESIKKSGIKINLQEFEQVTIFPDEKDIPQ